MDIKKTKTAMISLIEKYVKDITQSKPSGNIDQAHLKVAIFSPSNPPDDLEQTMSHLLGRLSWINYILSPPDYVQCIHQIRTHNTNGHKFDLFVFAGHGDGEKPYIKLGGHGIMPVDVDIGFWRCRYKKGLERIKQLLVLRDELKLKGNLTPQETTGLAKTEKEIVKITDGNLRSKIFVDNLETTSDVMNAEGKVILFNCSTAATPEGVNFVHNLGKLLLGKRGGIIAAPSNDFKVCDVENKYTEWLTGKDIGDVSFYADWLFVEIPANQILQAENKINPVIDVHFDPAVIAASPGQKIIVKPVIDPMSDSGNLSFWWNGAGTPVEDYDTSIEIPFNAQEDINVTVIAQDKRGRKGESTLKIKVNRPDKKGFWLLVDVKREDIPANEEQMRARGWFGKATFGDNMFTAELGGKTGAWGGKVKTTWNTPPKEVAPGEKVKMQFTAEVDYNTNKEFAVIAYVSAMMRGNPSDSAMENYAFRSDNPEWVMPPQTMSSDGITITVRSGCGVEPSSYASIFPKEFVTYTYKFKA